MRSAAEVRADWLRALQRTAPLAREGGPTLPGVLEQLAEGQGSRPALVSDGAAITYAGLAGLTNRYTRWAMGHGVGPGSTVCLLMRNRPEYPAIWLGISRAGGTTALVNTHLTGAALAHAVGVAGAGHLVVDAALAGAVRNALPLLPPGLRCWLHGAPDAGAGTALPAARIDEAVQEYDATPLPAGNCPMPKLRGRALLIYTSGTTGLPKAVPVHHGRVAEWALWFAGMVDVTPDDRMLLCLPMYHSVGGVALLGAAVAGGASVLVRERFSASRFWDDAADWGATLFPYVGELCRYLADAPPHPREGEHRLRLACGNGMRGEVWARFQARFRVPRILEFYAATEGAVSLYNCEEVPGAIGRVPPFLGHRAAPAVVRLDPDLGEPLRDAEGRCVPCAPDEPGELLGRLPDGAPAASYTDRVASERKLLRGAFADGDAWFRTGDLVRRDEAGFYRFVDRLGDTFRWKGENVSAAEVEEAARACPGVRAAAAYGVAVPGTEGRAGMLAVVAGGGFAPGALRDCLAERLPPYARPVFLRLCARIEETGTFKPAKGGLQRDGWDPGATGDPMWFDDRAAGAYVTLDAALRGRLLAGELRP